MVKVAILHFKGALANIWNNFSLKMSLFATCCILHFKGALANIWNNYQKDTTGIPKGNIFIWRGPLYFTCRYMYIVHVILELLDVSLQKGGVLNF